MSQVQADAIHERYRKSFVGRARATRELPLLDGIIADTEALLPTLSGALRDTVNERLTLYKSERNEIAAIQKGGPAVLAGWRAVEWSEINFARYRRHFAGQSRLTRDLGLLGEMAAEERANLGAIPGNAEPRLAAQREQITNNLKLFDAELKAIPEARTQQAPVEQARIYASAANAQFENWRTFFQGKPRATRRPALLERMVATLEDVRGRMNAVRDMGVATEAHTSNIGKVSERIGAYRAELEKIHAARAQMTGLDLAGRLGDEANAVFKAYRAEFGGKPRAQADVARLSALCDELQEIARTMRLLDAERPVEQNGKNLTIVLDHLKMMEREHQAIVESKAGKK